MLSSMTAAFSDLIYAAGPRFYSLFLVFPSALASSLATTEGNLGRLSGVAFAAQSVVFFMIMRWGIRGQCEIT